jgi:2,3,4,5-tetrahydropyridine-2,6-dicarboxylate N-succinyltransferase
MGTTRICVCTLLSHRLIRPRDANLDGVLELLTDLVWTNHGPIAVENFAGVHARLRIRGPVTVLGVGKIPRMVDYVIPPGVRIADGARVQAAHLAPGHHYRQGLPDRGRRRTADLARRRLCR